MIFSLYRPRSVVSAPTTQRDISSTMAFIRKPTVTSQSQQRSSKSMIRMHELIECWRRWRLDEWVSFGLAESWLSSILAMTPLSPKRRLTMMQLRPEIRFEPGPATDFVKWQIQNTDFCPKKRTRLQSLTPRNAREFASSQQMTASTSQRHLNNQETKARDIHVRFVMRILRKNPNLFQTLSTPTK